MLARALVVVLALAAPVRADTLLAGFDSALMPATCFISAQNITSHVWKAFRWNAAASGDIAYFKMRLIEPTDSRDDNFVWAIYDDDQGRVGALRAYGSYQGYDWTARSVGEHTFPPTTVVGSPRLEGGRPYWLVAYSRDMDATTFTSSAVIRTQRGSGACAPGVSIRTTDLNRWLVPDAPPPPGSYTLTMASYHAWSVWAREPAVPDTTPPAAPRNLRLGR